jgi:hypothetical protein
MGVESAKKMIGEMEGVEALLIFSDENGNTESYVTDGVKPLIRFVD